MPIQNSIYLKTATNRILPECQAGATEGALWLYLKGMTMPEAAVFAFNPEETACLEFHYGNLYSEFRGFTNVKAIMDRESQIEVMLTGGRVTKEDEKYEGNMDEDGPDGVSDGDRSAAGDLHPDGEAE